MEDVLSCCAEVRILAAPASLLLVYSLADASMHLLRVGHSNSRGLNHKRMLKVLQVSSWKIKPFTGDQVALI